MTPDERWLFAVRWVEEHSRTICGYVRNHHLLDYSAYEMQDFISEAYLEAYKALSAHTDVPFEAYFWNQFKNRCKVLSNKPHKSRFINAADLPLQSGESIDYDEKTIAQYLAILTPKQRAAFIEPDVLNISRQALQQRINSAIKTIQTFKQYSEE